MSWWLTNLRHVRDRGHYPEWHLAGGVMWYCMRCIKGGHRARRAALVPKYRRGILGGWS